MPRLKKERARLHQGWATHKRLCDTAKGCRDDWPFSYNSEKKDEYARTVHAWRTQHDLP